MGARYVTTAELLLQYFSALEELEAEDWKSMCHQCNSADAVPPATREYLAAQPNVGGLS
jgi:hypothetical protein